MKNKFFEAHRVEEKDVEMDCSMEEEKASQCSSVEMEVEEPEQDVLEQAKAKRAERWKAILKELEVCDLLDLWNP